MAAVVAVIFALPHTWWAFGVEATFLGTSEEFEDGFRSGITVFLIYDIAVAILAYVAAAIALALGGFWQAPVSRVLLRRSAWLGSGLLIARFLLGVFSLFASDVDPFSWEAFWELMFGVFGVTLMATAYTTRDVREPVASDNRSVVSRRSQ